MPEELGGQDLSLLGLTVITEELARSVALPARGPGIFGPEVRSILLSLIGRAEEAIPRSVLKGVKATAFAQTEPDAGADQAGCGPRRCARATTTASAATSDTSHMPKADFQLVASTDPKKGSRGGLTVFLVDMDTPGVSIAGRTVHMMGDVTLRDRPR